MAHYFFHSRKWLQSQFAATQYIRNQQSKAESDISHQDLVQQTSNPQSSLVEPTPDKRLEEARKVGDFLKQRGSKIGTVTDGENEDTIVFTSKVFQKSEGRFMFMELYGLKFMPLQCQLGFKKVLLSDGSIIGGTYEYDLACPDSNAKQAAAWRSRREFTTDLQSDFQRMGFPLTADLQGPNQDQLILISNTFKKSESKMGEFFQALRQASNSDMCKLGIQAVRLQSSGNDLNYSDYSLNCVN